MTALAPPPHRTTAEGGMPARRAMVRWAWRLLRREWRSQTLVVLLMLVAVATAVCGGSLLYNVPSPADSIFGTADNMYQLNDHDPRTLASDLAALRSAYGTIDLIARTDERVPGLTQPIEYRAQRLHGPYSADLLAIRHGRYPAGPNEAAVTTGVLQLLGLKVGGSISLDGHARKIVGVAEDPSKLSDDFVLVAPDAAPPPEIVKVLTSGRPRQRPNLSSQGPALGHGSDNSQAVAATLVMGGATVLLLLVSFVAAAGFAAVAHRRLRQLGMLAAIGATERQVRLVMTATGLLVGAVASVAGIAVGLTLWPLVAKQLESPLDHRISLLDIPWPLVVAVAVLAVLMSAVAAWWPARAVSRVPITLALSGRPPTPRTTHRSALLAAIFLVAGLGSLAVGQKTKPWLIVVGMVATALAILFVAPLAVRLLATVAARTPIAVRLALRDLARYQARSGAAVAAISLAMGIPVAIAIITTGIQGSPAHGNLSDRQLLIRLSDPGTTDFIPVRGDAQVNDLSARVAQLAAAIPHARLISLRMAIDPASPVETSPENGTPSRHATMVGREVGNQTQVYPLYVATPELLQLLHKDPATIPAATDLITDRPYQLVTVGVAKMPASKGSPTNRPHLETWPTTRAPGPAYTSLPDTLLTSDGLARHHLVPIQEGWLIEASAPLTHTQLGAARGIAANAGLSIESRDHQGAATTVRASATVVGVLVALMVLAVAVGLIRSEAAADLRTLTATGASSSIRRTLTAATAAALALLGVLLGTAGAVLGLLAVYRHDLVVFGEVPLAYPLVILLGVPAAAAVTGWLFAGREPPAIARRLAD